MPRARGVWRWPLVGVWMPLVGGACAVCCVFHARPVLRVGRGAGWSPLPSCRGGCICSDVSRGLVRRGVVPVPFGRPSAVFRPAGAAGGAGRVGPGSVPSSLTCGRPTLASARRVFAHKIVPNGVQLWRRLCSPLGVPPDDDDYYIGVHGCADAAGVHIKRSTIGSEDSRSRLTNCTPAPHPFPTCLLATRARVTVAARCSP